MDLIRSTPPKGQSKMNENTRRITFRNLNLFYPFNYLLVFIQRFRSTQLYSVRRFTVLTLSSVRQQIGETHFNSLLMAVGTCIWPFQLQLRDN